jgi:hypothetical protein
MVQYSYAPPLICRHIRVQSNSDLSDADYVYTASIRRRGVSHHMHSGIAHPSTPPLNIATNEPIVQPVVDHEPIDYFEDFGGGDAMRADAFELSGLETSMMTTTAAQTFMQGVERR